MNTNTFASKIGLIMGVANDRSIAWAISRHLFDHKAELAFTYLPTKSGERRIRQLLDSYPVKLILPCDVQKDEHLDAVFDAIAKEYGRLDFLVHSIAFAPPAELRRPYLEVSRAGWHLAMDISAYSLVAVCQRAAALMKDGGAIVTITYFGGEKVVPGYNLMGVCKAALEHSVRYLAWDLGKKGIRINAISAGPLRTLSSAGINGFDYMQEHAAKKACLGRNIQVDEVAETALFLLGSQSSGITGEIIHVDCGYNIVGL